MYKYVWTENKRTITRHAAVVLGEISEPNDLTINAVFHGQKSVSQDYPLPRDMCVLCIPVSKRFPCKTEVFMAETMKNTVSWDIKTQFVPHSKHITLPLQSPAG
jgi:hypothetical protein